jgi:hypothetical protein
MKWFSIVCALGLASAASASMDQGEVDGSIQGRHMAPESQLQFLETLYEYKSIAEKAGATSPKTAFQLK